MKHYTCPVCGYDQLEEAPADHNICECCGTQFGYHDAAPSHAELREQWIAGGRLCHNRRFGPSPGWNPELQIERLKVSA